MPRRALRTVGSRVLRVWAQSAKWWRSARGGVPGSEARAVLVQRSLKHPHQYDAPFIDRHDLGHSGIGLLVANDDEHPRRQDNPALDVLHARMGEPGTVPPVIVEPKVPAHGPRLPATSWIWNGRIETQFESIQCSRLQIWQEDIEIWRVERGQQCEPQGAQATHRRESDLAVSLQVLDGPAQLLDRIVKRKEHRDSKHADLFVRARCSAANEVRVHLTTPNHHNDVVGRKFLTKHQFFHRADENYSILKPDMARAMTSCWISDVPSKIVWIFASRCQRSTGKSRVYPTPPRI